MKNKVPLLVIKHLPFFSLLKEHLIVLLLVPIQLIQLPLQKVLKKLLRLNALPRGFVLLSVLNFLIWLRQRHFKLFRTQHLPHNLLIPQQNPENIYILNVLFPAIFALRQQARIFIQHLIDPDLGDYSVQHLQPLLHLIQGKFQEIFVEFELVLLIEGLDVAD